MTVQVRLQGEVPVGQSWNLIVKQTCVVDVVTIFGDVVEHRPNFTRLTPSRTLSYSYLYDLLHLIAQMS